MAGPPLHAGRFPPRDLCGFRREAEVRSLFPSLYRLAELALSRRTAQANGGQGSLPHLPGIFPTAGGEGAGTSCLLIGSAAAGAARHAGICSPGRGAEAPPGGGGACACAERQVSLGVRLPWGPRPGGG